MLKALCAVLGLMVGLNVQAKQLTLVDSLIAQQSAVLSQEVVISGINWKVGDTNNYNIDMGFIQGKMVMSVKSVGADGIWMKQDMDLGFAGKQNAELLIDPNTGEIKKMLVNGKEQTPPKSNVEVVDMKEDKVTVPAGTYECIHAILKDKDKNEEINTWVNPQQIPLSGMLKTIQPSQFGNVTIELTSFKKN